MKNITMKTRRDADQINIKVFCAVNTLIFTQTGELFSRMKNYVH